MQETIHTDKPENLIKPMKAKRFYKPNTKIGSGVYQKSLRDMGIYRTENDELFIEESDLLTHLTWDIAHHNYRLLLPCISITDTYHYKRQTLPYQIDLYGDGKIIKEERLYVANSDFHYLYMRLGQKERKTSLLERIALSSVGLLVPFITIQGWRIDENDTVHADYSIVV